MAKRPPLIRTERDIELRAVRPSAAVRAGYEKRLDREIAMMQRSLVYWLKARYRRELPRMALDASPARELRDAIRKLSRRWQVKFDELAPKLAEHFARASMFRVDGELERMLRDHGFTVRFRMSRGMRNAYQATIEENVTLIKSIAAQHLKNVEGAVMRSVSTGRDLGTLSKELEETYGVTRRRAASIARSQNNMATATLTRTRQIEMGVTKAKWLHSAGGQKPRPEHVAFSGKTYDIAKGAYLEGKRTWPGKEINCRCVSVPIIPGFA